MLVPIDPSRAVVHGVISVARRHHARRTEIARAAMAHGLVLALLAFFTSRGALAMTSETRGTGTPAPGSRVPVKLCLDDAIELATARSPEVIKASGDVARAELSMVEARAASGPSVTFEVIPASYSPVSRSVASSGSLALTYLGTIIKAEVTKTPGHDMKWNLSLSRSLTQDPAALRALDAMADSEESLESARLALEHARARVGLEVEEAYYSVLRADEQVRIARSALALLRQYLRRAEESSKQGNLSEADLMAARREAMAGEHSARRAEEAATMARLRLGQLLGLSAGTPLELVPVATDLCTVDPDAGLEDIQLDDLIARALSADYDVKSRSLVVRSVERKLALAESRPDVDISCFAGTDDGHAWSLGLTVSYVIAGRVRDAGPGDGGLRVKTAKDAEIARYEEELKSLRMREAWEREALEVRVRGLYYDLVKAGDTLELSRISEQEAELRLEAAREGFERGIATQLDVMEATVKLSEARINRIFATYDYLIARSRLLGATGGARA
ncbi:MAG TPA: TolC family protein [Firmicutes bacterium]|nr:TolC family protein [Bacillota bacterium]